MTDPREKARHAWDNWTQADMEEELAPWPSSVAAPARRRQSRGVIRRVTVTFPGGAVDAELVQTGQTRAIGLMHRTSLPRDGGMLFSWPEERVRAFWMKNTFISLDMIFISARGEVVGVLRDVQPLSDAAQSVPVPAMHVLEVNAGWAREHGVEVGQLVQVQL